jgi:hypothetical protein
MKHMPTVEHAMPWFRIRLYPKGFQNIRAAHSARDADISVLGNRHARATTNAAAAEH